MYIVVFTLNFPNVCQLIFKKHTLHYAWLPKKLNFFFRFQMDRWIQMHYQIKEREFALEISRSRELFFWLGSFYTVTLMGIVSRQTFHFNQRQPQKHKSNEFYRYRTTRRGGILAPVVPMSFVLAYYADLAYGSKIHRIRGWFV